MRGKTGSARGLSLINRRKKPLQEAIDRRVIYPADHSHQVMVWININHVDPIADMSKRTGRRAWPQFLVGVEKPVHETIGRLRLRRGERPVDPLIGEQLAVVPRAVTQREIAEACHVVAVDKYATTIMAAARDRLNQTPV